MNIFSTLAEALPKLKTKLQLSGFIVLIAAVVATRSIAPTALNAQISAGAIGILFIVFGQVFSSLRDIPETDRSRLILFMFSVFCLFVLALVITTSIFIAKAGPTTPLTPADAVLVPTKGSLLISSGTAARISLDGKDIAILERGQPLTQEVPPGDHELHAVSLDGAHHWHTSVYVKSGAQVSVVVAFPVLPPLAPQDPCALYARAKELDNNRRTVQAKDKYAEALRTWDLATNKSCEESFIYKDLGYLLLLQAGDSRGAVEDFLSALGAPIVDSSQPRHDNDVYRGLERALLALGEPQGAIDAATKLANDPNDGCQHYELAKYLNQKGDWNSGDLQARINEYQRALDNWPANDKDCTAKTNVIKDLGCAYATQQDAVKAHEYLSQQPDEQVAAYCLGKLHR